MDVLLADIRLRLDPASNLQLARLVVGAVRARHEFFVFSLERKPGFEIVLLGGSVVESARHDGHDPVGELQGLIKLLGDFDHVVKGLPRVLGGRVDELLNLSN